MVALSLYKGNLHRVPEAPRRWLLPTPKISLKDFRILLRRRSRALSRLLTTTTPPDAVTAAATTTTTTYNPNPKTESNSNPHDEVPALVPVKAEKEEEVQGDNGKLSEQLINASDVVVDPKLEVFENGEKLEVPVNPSRFEILNAEEELKRRSMQGMAVRSSLPLQVDTTNDSGSMTRLNTPRMGSDGNLIGEMDGEGGDDASNQNMLSRNLLRMSSTSPSSESQLRKTPYNVVPLSSRSFGVTGSPSRFAPPGQQGQPSNLPPMSLSGTNLVASSPSPAASGGTSVFRDRFSSP
uniref:Uncharacterized protein LOC104210016 isoform X2 n=1 Tax=Nicotiana sylvestris TaxID=4096 RepID=A0A1U7V5V9_NICSY|nr:PREDICTED: uncharacterized protein LOC104210016 isoform X2 [Nicotiana sylvestris]